MSDEMWKKVTKVLVTYHHDELQCTIRTGLAGSHWVEFQVFEHGFVTEKFNETSAEDPIEYERKGAQSSMDWTSDLDNAEPLVHGSIKWDGCSHMNFGRDGYIHFCSPEQAARLGVVLPMVYEQAGDMMLEADPTMQILFGPRDAYKKGK